MKHEKYFNRFMEQEVNLNQNRVNKLDAKVRIITGFLKTDLDGYQKRENQGSYAMKTIIKPPKNKEFDADIMIYVNEESDLESKDYIQQIYDLFRNNDNYKNIVKSKTRCVTIDYAGDFHLDIVPCVEKRDQKYVCNKDSNEFEKTDGAAYKKWLIEQNKVSGNYLKKVIKLFKYQRDIKTNYSCKSILLTTLIGNTIEGEENFSDLPTALKEISIRLNKFLQDNPNMPTIKNPALDSEDFNRHWDDDKYRNFRDKIDLYTNKIKDAYNLTGHNESVKKWREVFGDEFGECSDNSTTNTAGIAAGVGITAPTVTSANKPYGCW